MAKRKYRGLTKQILRQAAETLSPNSWEYGHKFMCYEVEAAAYKLHGYRNEAGNDFAQLLEDHKISIDGSLRHRNKNYNERDDCQEIRFDFLNLLAESME